MNQKMINPGTNVYYCPYYPDSVEIIVTKILKRRGKRVYLACGVWTDDYLLKPVIKRRKGE
jgi:hypothetical protein